MSQLRPVSGLETSHLIHRFGCVTEWLSSSRHGSVSISPPVPILGSGRSGSNFFVMTVACLHVMSGHVKCKPYIGLFGNQ